MRNTPVEVNATVVRPSFAEAFRFWLKLGFISFGGPAGQIAIMQSELVEKRRWIDHARFLHALNFCMLLPGPEATELAIYIGWLLHRTVGGITAGVLFVAPSIFILWALSAVYVSFGNVPWIAATFYGLKPAVMAIVAVAVIRIGRKGLTSALMWGVAASAFVAIFWLRLPYPVVVFAALLIGFFRKQDEHVATVSAPNDSSWTRSIRVTAVCLAVWWAPILLMGLCAGWNSTLFREGIFFSKAAVITFGGAYAVLPYVAQHA
ncbi:MAG TPA: chromate transporter, partial [Chthoniobacterales bacterium]